MGNARKACTLLVGNLQGKKKTDREERIILKYILYIA
jgi:hypothetical protein